MKHFYKEGTAVFVILEKKIMKTRLIMIFLLKSRVSKK